METKNIEKMDKKFYSRKEASSLLKVTLCTLEAMNRQKQIKSVLQQKSWLNHRKVTRFPKKEVFRLAELLEKIRSSVRSVKRMQEAIKLLTKQKQDAFENEMISYLNKSLKESREKLKKAKEELKILKKRKKDGK